jgi:thioredoxin reductase (NADPH)
VTLICRGNSLENNMSSYLIRQLGERPSITARFQSEVVAAQGELALEAVEIRNNATGNVERQESGGLFIFVGADAETAWLPQEIALDARGYVLTGPDAPCDVWQLERDPYLLETSVPGVFACGDVRSGPVKRVVAAAGEGSMAIAFVHQYLKDDAARAALA